jgi:cell division protein FtsA
MNAAMTDALMKELYNECKAHQPEDLDVLSVLPPACYLDGRFEPNPVGTLCSRVEAKYQQIVARPALRKSIEASIPRPVELAGIFISPLVLADTVLSEVDKDMGCALIDFGAGVTSLSVYQKGRLVGLSVIPLGGNLITKDLSNILNIVEADAEQNKIALGRAIADEDVATSISLNSIDRKELHTIPLKEFNGIVAARQQEILENVYTRLKEIVGEKDAAKIKNFLRAGVIITGRAAELDQLEVVVCNCFKLDVRKVTSVRKDLLIKTVYQDMNLDAISIGLLSQGYVNCAVQNTVKSPEMPPRPAPVNIPAPEPKPKPEPKPEPVVVVEEPTPTPAPAPEPVSPSAPVPKPKPLKDKFAGFVGRFFDEN